MADNGLYISLFIIALSISIDMTILLVEIEKVLERVKKLEQLLREKKE